MPLRLMDGWKRTATPKLCTELIAGSHDPMTKTSRLYRIGKRTEILPVSAHGVRSLSCALGRLYFLAHEGLVAYQPDTQTEQVILPGKEGVLFGPMWVRMSKADVLVLQTETRPGSQLKRSLLRVDLGGRRSKLIKQFRRYPAFVEFSESSNGLFISYHVNDESKRIDRIDLDSARSQPVYKSEILHGIAVSPGGNLIHWPLVDFGPITEVKNNGSMATLTEFGWFPAISKRGDMAFLMGDHTFWIRTRSSRLTRVGSYWSTLDAGNMQPPVWCPCGNHVALLLGGTHQGPWLARDLIVADIVRKEAAVFDGLIIDPSNNNRGVAWL